MDTAVPAEFVQLGVVAGESPMVPMAAGAVCPRGAGLALAERVGVIEIDLPDGVRVRVASEANRRRGDGICSGSFVTFTFWAPGRVAFNTQLSGVSDRYPCLISR
jgi:hypothetical protein